MNLAAEKLAQEFGEAPKLLIVLGSGLSKFADELQSKKSLFVSELPGGKASTVEGHKGQILVGTWNSIRLACLSGRLHGFEGHSPSQVVFALRSLRKWGVEKFILTNATGSTHPGFAPGEVVLISDHINFTGQNPLVGTELFDGPRFPDSSDIYSKKWRAAIKARAVQVKANLKEAVYVGVLGPSYETAAEIRMFHRWGGDIVGMSTVWEALALKQMGAEVVGLSLVSNFATGVVDQELKHEDVLAIGLASFEKFKTALSWAIEESGVK